MNFKEDSFMVAIALCVVFFVVAQALFFLVRAVKRAKELGIANQTIKNTIVSSSLFTIAPAIGIVATVLTLSAGLGYVLPWIRLTVIGNISYEVTAATNAVAMTAAVSVRRRCEPSVISRKPPRTARSISSGEKSPSGPIRTSTSPPLCRMWGRNALPRAERGASQWAMNFCPSKGCLMTCRSGVISCRRGW